MAGRLRRSYAKRQEFNAIKLRHDDEDAVGAPPGRSELTKDWAATVLVAAAIVVVSYFGGPTQTATSGVLATDPAGPQDAPLSPRNCA